MSGWHVVWHYRDLRVEDNPALAAAAANGKVLPFYIHGPEEEGSWSIGGASKWWLHQSLQSLSSNYKELGSRLVIRSGKALDVLQQLASEIEVAAVYWNNRYQPALQARDHKVLSHFRAHNVPVHTFEGNYLITPTEILNKSGSAYSVYTPFSKAVVASCSWREPLGRPTLSQGHRVASEEIDHLQLLPKRDWADHFPNHWTPGREGAVKALHSFEPTVVDYQEQRDFPAQPGTSRLSPHLAFGEVSPQEVWKATESASSEAFPFLRQLLWREFGNYFLYHFPLASDRSWRGNFEDFPWEKNRAALKAWQMGQTGYPIVDAGMRELWQTGYMHNRVRMIVASFLVKDLFVHWVEGARWFWDTLLDADLANNSLGWQWTAGCGPDAAPYFRIFNPTLQGKKFDPDGTYVRQWVPELSNLPLKWLHTPWEAPALAQGYPEPIVDHSEARDKALAAYATIK